MVSIYIIHNGEHYEPDEGLLEVKEEQVKEEQPSGSAGNIANFLFLFPVGWV